MLTPYPDGRLRISPLAPPLQAKEVGELPHGEDWIYEFLWSGERVRAVKRDGGVQLVSRDNRDLTNRFPRIAAAVAKLRAVHVVIDGEILYLDTYSEPALRFLAEATDDPSNGRLAFLAYDLLCNEGKDLRQHSLLCRRVLLASLVQGTPIVLSPLIDGNSETALASAARLGFRGVVAKRAGSAYRPNSLTTDWVKLTFPASAASDAARQSTRNPFTGNDNPDVADVPAGVR
jgi:bifunctional non-homologous end joining protein LigD